MPKLNNTDMSILNPGAMEIKHPVKIVVKNALWEIETIKGRIVVPCSIQSTTKEELVQKLNDIDVWLKDGQLYINEYERYEVKLLIGIVPQADFNNFKLTFQINDEFVTYVFPYTATTHPTFDYNPLEAYNFTGTFTDPMVEEGIIEIDPEVDNIVTGDFACLNGTIYALSVPDGYIVEGTNIVQKEDVANAS
jgi:hypothetical protein